MTLPARVTEADIRRVLRVVRRDAPGSRVTIDLMAQRIEIALPVTPGSAVDDDNPWEKDGAPQ